ncbi:MAG: hypothetical protein ACD_71C00154G0007 [uncultured bacterium (gcode 4)]|uniref:Uncharacterized protein n=1 Tax=uncultured bacterium (gcode 4) TaxID=1234023 RepID=K1YN44_9BACT|nr:MAG: hypothetical protein ACD_71C00154G0007 [uncultured bacterium (gcode 4)]
MINKIITLQRVRLWIAQKMFHLRVRSIGIFQNRFRLLSFIQVIITIVLFWMAIKSNFFHGIDASAYFTTVWSMFGSILALLITIHFFYIQNFSNYVPLAFVFHANTNWTSYLIIGTIWTFTLVFLFLWGNIGAYLNSCPDYYIFPLSVLAESLVVWLVFYFFHITSQNLSPAWITNLVEKFFLKTLNFVKKNELLLENYGKLQGVTEDFQRISKFYSWMWPIEICWVNLETLCDAVQMLMSRKEYSLSTGYLAVISKCFWYLLDAHWKITTVPNLEYFLTQESGIDKRLDRLFEKVENIVFLNIRGNDTYGILESMSLLKQITIKTSEVQYSWRMWFSENPVFERVLLRHTWLFDKLLKEWNEEWLFQWKENSFAYLKIIISKKIALWYVESILEKLDLFVFWEISNWKSYETHKIYMGLLLPFQSDKWNVVDINELACKHIEWIISLRGSGKDNIDIGIDQIINSIIKEVWNYLVMNHSFILQKILSKPEESDVAIESWSDLINNINLIFQKGAEKKIHFDNFFPLLISEFRGLCSSVTRSELNEKSKEKLLEDLLNLISIVVWLGDKKFLSGLYSNKHIFDTLCWLGLYGLKTGNSELFEESRSIFEKYLSDSFFEHFHPHLDVAEYYFFWILAIRDNTSLIKTSEAMIDFFVENLRKNFLSSTAANTDFSEHIRTRTVIFVNDIKSVLAPSDRTYPIDEPSSIDYISESFPESFTEEKREQLMSDVLLKCEFLVKKSEQG